MFNKIFKGLKENEINLLCREYSSGDYVEDSEAEEEFSDEYGE